MNSNPSPQVDTFESKVEHCFRDALATINELEFEGTIGRYTIGGFSAIIFYGQPVCIFDLDIYSDVESSQIAPIRQHLIERGFKPEINSEQSTVHFNRHLDAIRISGIAVRFAAATSAIMKEATADSRETTIAGVSTRVIGYEFQLAICAQQAAQARTVVPLWAAENGLAISSGLESALPDQSALDDILERHSLTDIWRTQYQSGIEEHFENDAETGEEYDLTKPVTREMIYRSKKQWRQQEALKPFEEKIKSIWRMQVRNQSMKLAVKRPYRLPWGVLLNADGITINANDRE